MKKMAQHIFDSVSDYHAAMNIKKPTHPLVSVVRLEDICPEFSMGLEQIVFNFYTIFLKRNFDGKVKYGQKYYDFDNGTMTFFAPKQLISLEGPQPTNVDGWMLVIHPDFLHGYPLAKKIKDYGFFHYASYEALHVSEAEDEIVVGLMQSLQREIEAMIDNYTQDVVVSHIELLLNYCNRFYNRQFITRKKVANDLFLKFEDLLNAYYQNDNLSVPGLPGVQYFSEKLFVSAHYLNDMLKNLTGQTTQQHIQNQLLEKAKELLSTTTLSISEIAYQLGFEYPQSFSKLFKSKTRQTPLEFRTSFS